MADATPAVSAAATAAEHGGSAAAELTDMEERTPLAELLSDQTGAAGSWDLKVFYSDIKEYKYTWKAKEQTGRKLVVILLSLDADQYCLGLARAAKSGESLEALQARFATGTVWRFSNVTLNTSEKAQYLHTACRIAINLRSSRAARLLQSMRFPTAPEPATTIAAILQLKDQQRFDLMAVPTKILDQRRSGAGQIIIDVRLADGSTHPDSHSCATMPLTIFLSSTAQLDDFKQHVGCNPLLFMCLNGQVGQRPQGVEVRTIKEQFFWRVAAGARCDEMKAKNLAETAAEHQADVVVLPQFTPSIAAEYLSLPATLSACSILDMKANAVDLLDEAAAEHIYQLNHVYVPSPTAGQTVQYENRLFVVFDCWDFSKKIQLAFREKAILSLAQQEESDSVKYVAALNAHEIKHPLLASLRVRVKKSENTDDSHLNTLVVEATPVCWDADAQIPNDSVNALHGLLAMGGPPSSERLVAARLQEIAHSPFYNMTVAGEPAEKAVVLLHFTQRSVGAQKSGGFRVVTDNVIDGSDLSKSDDSAEQLKVGIVARCTVERCPDFTAMKASYAIAVVCKATLPAKPQHALDLYIEAMEVLSKEQIHAVRETLAKLRSVAAAARTETEPSVEKAFQQKKCRRLLRYPTLSC
jgi:hypothetical protein